MSGVHRETDPNDKHGCFPVQIPKVWSGDVFVNNLGVVRKDDLQISHGCGTCTPHEGIYMGEHSVYVNGKSAQVIGDTLDPCGLVIINGSGDVFVE
jgi:uncharacterized Zn-binding protein involved in type VI secretion